MITILDRSGYVTFVSHYGGTRTECHAISMPIRLLILMAVALHLILVRIED